MGLSPLMVDKIFEVVREVSRQGVTVLLVEQNASRALAMADRGYVMESGLITLSRPGAGAAARPGGARGLPGRIRRRLPTAARVYHPPSNLRSKGAS